MRRPLGGKTPQLPKPPRVMGNSLHGFNVVAKRNVARVAKLKEPAWKYNVEIALVVAAVLGLVALGLIFSPKLGIGGMGGGGVGGAKVACTNAELEKAKLVAAMSRKWHLVGKEVLTKEPAKINFSFTDFPTTCILANSFKLVYQVSDSQIAGEVPATGALRYSSSFDIASLKVKEYTVSTQLLDAQGAKVLEANTKLYISKPVYVAWTLDWEGYNFSNTYLEQIQQLTERTQTVPLTHFFNPRYFIEGSTLKARGGFFRDWIKNRQSKYGDEVGLHLHMFYDMVKAAGIEEPLKDPTWASRGTGSDVPLSSYTYEEQKQVIEFGKKILGEQGFKDLKSFRAGGWFTSLETLRALEDTGFQIESSGRTYYSLGNGLYGPWRLDEAAQPYYPCRTNQNQACKDAAGFSVMEIPNNGLESYRYPASQLINRFKSVFNGKVQGSHKSVVYLSHPEWFNIDQPKMNELFKHIDKYSYADDKGPVVYATLNTIRNAWQVNNY